MNKYKINLYSAIAIVVGSVIGSSIFIKPAIMAQQLPHVGLLILVWIAAGCISLIGAMINAEIGSMMPETGGQFVYFQKIYGDRLAFIYGWSCLTVINTASVAAIAFVFAQYSSYFIDLPTFGLGENKFSIIIPLIGQFYIFDQIGVKALAIATVMLLTYANHNSLKSGGKIQNYFTWLKVGLLVFISLAIFFSGKGNFSNFTQSQFPEINLILIMGIVASLSGAFAAFDGWNNVGFVAGEMDNPQKNLPKALGFGLLICFVLYLCTNLSFYYILPLDHASKSQLIATDAISPVVGNIGTGLIAFMVMVSTFGAINGNILACTRVTFSMGNSGNFFSWTGLHHRKNGTPSNALWLHAAITCLYILSGSFDMLADLFVFVTWLFYAMAAFGIFILRKKMSSVERPFKIFGFPYLPI
ncbi:MAG: hypothetical protein RLZZ546_1812, partial [Bacteroidota bacterium]